MNLQGIYKYADGSRYEGSWENDKIHGDGVSYYPDGDRYEGSWTNGKINGVWCRGTWLLHTRCLNHTLSPPIEQARGLCTDRTGTNTQEIGRREGVTVGDVGLCVNACACAGHGHHGNVVCCCFS